MKLEYLRTAKTRYMLVMGLDVSALAYELKMIQKNRIPCLLPFQMIPTDGRVEYWYDVSGMLSLQTQCALESLNGNRIRLLLENLMDMKAQIEEYLLDDANICFLPETLYFERTPERIRFCYIPGLGASAPETPGLRGLAEELLRHVNHADSTAVRMGYEMYERCAHSTFDMADCADCLRIGKAPLPPEERAVSEPAIRWDGAGGGVIDFAPSQDIDLLFGAPHSSEGHRRKRKPEKEVSAEQRKGAGREHEILHPAEWKKNPFRAEKPGEDEMLFTLQAPEPTQAPELEHTQAIPASEAGRAWKLVYKGGGVETDLTLSDFPFRVGTDKSRVQGALYARTVSRVHAQLDLVEGQLFVEDFNSTNGTYVNHALLPMNTRVKLNEGDRVVFATEEYEVYRRHAYGSIHAH